MRYKMLFPVVWCLMASVSLASQGRPNVDLQKDAMRKLAFLVGQWSGEALVATGPGAPTAIKQTEDVQFKLDGLVLAIEGTGRNPQTGAVEFNAFATVSFDEASKTYRLRAHSGGNFLEAEFLVRDRGFEWGYTSGPVKVTNTMALTDVGQWVETTDVVVNNNPPRRTTTMRLSK